jgi:hypothetical protein
MAASEWTMDTHGVMPADSAPSWLAADSTRRRRETSFDEA